MVEPSRVVSLTEPRALTAAAKRVTEADARQERNTALYGWQINSLMYAREIGEIWYASKFYERALRNLILIVQQKNAEGVWEKSENPEALAYLDGLRDANGEQSGLLGMYGRQHFLTGEARLLGTIDKDTGEDVWEMLSVREIHVNDQGEYIRQRSPGVSPETIHRAAPNVYRPDGTGAVMFRLWSPSPEFSDVADSPMRGVQTLCDELLLLTRLVRGEIKSRLSNNGLMGIPSELQLPATQQGTRPDEDPGADTLMDRLTRAMETGVSDESSPSALIPLIIRGPAELLDKIVHFRFDKPMGENQAKRDELIKRLALSLDMPPEALLGIGDTNHWGAWQIDESSWKVHIQPIAQTLVENLTTAYLRPLMQDATYRIWYDESEVVNHPDRSTDFKAAFDSYVISAEAYRTAIGAKDDMEMSPEEQDRFAQLRALEHRGTGASATPPDGSTEAAPAGPATGSPTVPASTPAQTPPAAPGPPSGPASVPAAQKSLAIAESVVWRCREVAGSRLRSKVDRASFSKVTNCDLAHAVRGETRQWDGTSPDALVAGAGALFVRQLCASGMPVEIAEQIVTAAEAHARDTLFDAVPGELPDELIGLCTVGSLGAAVPA